MSNATAVPSYLWSSDFSTESDYGEEANAIALNNRGDQIVVVGSTWGNVDTTLFSRDASHNDLDAFILAYQVDPDRPNVPPSLMWAKQFGSTLKDDEALSVVISEEGDIFVSGFSHQSLEESSEDEDEDDDAKRGYIVKYNPQGKRMWSFERADEIISLTYLPINFSVGPTLSPTLNSSSYGSHRDHWRRGHGRRSIANANATVEPNLQGTALAQYKNLTLTPTLSPSLSPTNQPTPFPTVSPTVTPTVSPTPMPTASPTPEPIPEGVLFATGINGDSSILLKLNDLGKHLWTKNMDPNIYPRNLEVGSPSTDVVFVGDFVFDDGNEYTTNCSLSGYNSTGSLLWNENFGAQKNTETHGYCVLVQPTNGTAVDVIVAGYTNGILKSASGHSGHRDAFLYSIREGATVNSSQTLNWVKQFGSEEDDMVVSLAPASDGAFYVTGQAGVAFSSSTNVGNDEGGNDIFVAKYDNNGDQLWCVHFGSMKDDTGTGIVVNHESNTIYTLGQMTSSSGSRYLSITALCESDCLFDTATPSSTFQSTPVQQMENGTAATTFSATETSTRQFETGTITTMMPTLQQTSTPSPWPSPSSLQQTSTPSILPSIAALLEPETPSPIFNVTALPTSSLSTNTFQKNNTTMLPSNLLRISDLVGLWFGILVFCCVVGLFFCVKTLRCTKCRTCTVCCCCCYKNTPPRSTSPGSARRYKNPLARVPSIQNQEETEDLEIEMEFVAQNNGDRQEFV